MMNVVSKARQHLDAVYQAQRDARLRQETIDTAFDMMTEVYITLDAQESEHGWIEDGIWVDLYRFAPKGSKPAYLVYVNGVVHHTILQAANTIADIWHS